MSAIPLLVPIAIATMTAGVVTAGGLFDVSWRLALGMSTELVAGTCSSLVFVAMAALVLPFTETSVTDVNRARERRAVRLRFAALVVEARWGVAVSGIVLVFAVLGYFGVEPMLAKSALPARPVLWAASALLVFLAAYGVGRDWREAVAALLALAAETLVSLWLWSAAVGHVTATPFVEIVTADATGLLLMLVLLGRARRHRADGSTPGVARLRALEECAVPALYGCAGATAAILPWTVLHGSMVTLALLYALAAVASIFGPPALATALDVLVRRRLSVEELYGRG